MRDVLEIQCPWCGERLEVGLEIDTWGELIEDCEVCCHPMKLTVTRDEWGDPDLRVDRAD